MDVPLLHINYLAKKLGPKYIEHALPFKNVQKGFGLIAQIKENAIKDYQIMFKI